MEITRRQDVAFAVAVALPLPAIAWLAGDPLFIGAWYYLAVSAGAIGLAAMLRGRPPFLSGVSCAAAVTLLAYMAINWHAARPEGLLGLGHLASLPGAGTGIVVGAILARWYRGGVAIFLCGLLGLLYGFLLNQLVVCNTLIWCGPLSWPMR